MTKFVFASMAILLLSLSSAQASLQHGVGATSYVAPETARRTVKAKKYKRHYKKAKRHGRHHIAARHHHRPSAQILPHPAGCPRSLFCGCGVAQRLLGKTVTRGGLAIAANWGGFPRAACAPGMAAVRRGHVFAIEECLPGNKTVAYDPNSGGGLTRRHVRSLAGYQIVNPHGAYTEVNGKPGRSYRSHRAVRYAKRRHRYAHAS